jgi:glycosyltransferase involved in cell wall biosynthesis
MSQRRYTILMTEDSMPLGGAERVLLQRLEHLDRRKFDVHLLTLRALGSLLPAGRELADHYECVHRQMGFDPTAIMRLRRYIKRHAVGVVHTNQWLDSLYVLFATSGLSVRRVATVHGYDRTWRNVVNLRVLKRFDRIICVSTSQRLDLFKMGIPWEKTTVVFNSCDAEFGAVPVNSRAEDPGRPFRIVTVAHFRWWRDPSTLVNAIAILRARGLDVGLHLVGDGDANIKAACQALVRERGIDSAVTFCAARTVDSEWLASFDLFATASLADTFGVAVLEAMSCGLPVLVSDIPPFMELIEHGRSGAYFRAGDAESCADNIAVLMEDSELRRSLARCATKRAAAFSAENTTADLEAVYQGLLGEVDR